MATHSSILAWEIPWTEEPGGLRSTGGKELDTTERLNNSTHIGTHPWLFHVTFLSKFYLILLCFLALAHSICNLSSLMRN